MIVRAFLMMALSALAATPSAAAIWTVDAQRSSITFGSVWNGDPVTGRFQRYRPAIRFDPARPQDAAIDVLIDLASASVGDRTIDASLPGADWFAVRTAPTARFTATGVKPTGPGRYVAAGTLTLRGRSVPVALPFTLAIRGDTAVVAGTAQLDRRAFGIGMESDPPGQWVVFPVTVRVQLNATRNP